MAQKQVKEEQLDIFTGAVASAPAASAPLDPPQKKRSAAAATEPSSVESLSIFDVNPDMSPEIVSKLNDWVGRLDVLIAELDARQKGQFSPELTTMKNVRDGMHTTATTGRDLVDIPPDEEIENFIRGKERKIAKMPTAEEKAKLDERIEAGRAEKKQRLMTEGTYAKPVTEESALAVFGDDIKAMSGLEFAISQGHPVISSMVERMEETRRKMNDLGVFDVSQSYQIAHTPIRMGAVTGEFYRYLLDKNAELTDSKRGDFMQRAARTAHFEITYFGATSNMDFLDRFSPTGNTQPSPIVINAEKLAAVCASMEPTNTPSSRLSLG